MEHVSISHGEGEGTYIVIYVWIADSANILDETGDTCRSPKAMQCLIYEMWSEAIKLPTTRDCPLLPSVFQIIAVSIVAEGMLSKLIPCQMVLETNCDSKSVMSPSTLSWSSIRTVR
jgi:hypothetical protein